MRQITRDAIEAFIANTNFSRSNTKVTVDSESVSLILHGNVIARKALTHNLETQITNAGWQSNTTKERLNGIPNVRIHQKNFEWFLNDQPWDGDWAIVYPNS